MVKFFKGLGYVFCGLLAAILVWGVLYLAVTPIKDWTNEKVFRIEQKVEENEEETEEENETEATATKAVITVGDKVYTMEV